MFNFLFKKKQSTVQILEDLTKKIEILEQKKKTNLEKQKRFITILTIYSIIIYLLAVPILYFYYLPDKLLWKIIYSIPLLIFPILVYLIKKFLRWFFVKRIKKNETDLRILKEKKIEILNEVMANVTFNKAREILLMFGQEVNVDTTPNNKNKNENLRQRIIKKDNNNNQQQQQQQQKQQQITPTKKPFTPQQQQLNFKTPAKIQQQQQQLILNNNNTPKTPKFNFQHSPFPAKNVVLFKKDRSIMDRLIDYFLNEGPENRYALICDNCHNHNGLTLKEEFEYITFRCSYCFSLNPAKKKKPLAPKIDSTPSSPFSPSAHAIPSSSASSISSSSSSSSSNVSFNNKENVTKELNNFQNDNIDSNNQDFK